MSDQLVSISSHNWDHFWERLDRAECSWAIKLDSDRRDDFAVAVESMVRAAVDPRLRDELRRSWHGLGIPRDSPWDNGDLRWNLTVSLDKPGPVTEKEVATVLDELKTPGDETSGRPTTDWDAVKAKLPHFLTLLKFAALHTAWRFVLTCSDYTSPMPDGVRNLLYEEVFEFALTELLRG